MAVKPGAKPPSKSDAKEDQSEAKHEPFVNEPSSLDEATHRELSLMHGEAANAILFAKRIQWRSVGASLTVFGALIVLAYVAGGEQRFVDILKVVTIVLAAGVIFVLVMYQFWQVNEINKLNAIDRHFSTLYMRIGRIKSRREGNIHRYTLLFFMIAVIMIGVFVAVMGIDQMATLKKPPY